MKTALIWGITGQIASYIAEEMLDKGYCVWGVKRRASTNNTWRIKHLIGRENFHVVEGDITDVFSVNSITTKVKPYCIINTSAQSHVHSSFEQPAYTFNVNANGVLNVLESIRCLSPETRFLQFSTSELFGSNYDIVGGEKVQNEETKFSPNSPYAVSKLAAYTLVQLYRRSYNIFSCNNLNFNTEGPRRGEEFVTRKVTKWVGEYCVWRSNRANHYVTFEDEYICCNGEKFPKLRLGNLKTYRDWSHAKDISRGVVLAVEYDKPDDYVFCSGVARTIEEFCRVAFAKIGIMDWENYIYIDKEFFRPCDVEYLRGSYDKANRVLGWKPKISFNQMVKEMVEFDIDQAKKAS